MAAALLCKRFFSRSKLYHSLSQATRMMDSPDPKSESLLPSDMPDYERKIPSENEGSLIQLITVPIKCPRNVVTVNWRVNDPSPDPPSLSDFNAWIKDLMYYDSKPQLVQLFLAQMLVRGTIPNLSTFSHVIKPYCKKLTYQHILDLFKQMKALGVKADDSFYETTVKMVVDRFGFYVGFHFIKKLRSSQRIQMPLSCYNQVVGQLCQRKSIDNESMVLVLIDVLMDMEQQQLFLDDGIYNRLLRLCNRVGVDEDLLKAVDIGRLMFAKGIRMPDREFAKVLSIN